MDTHDPDVLANAVIAFFNTVKRAEEIHETIVDDPNFGKPLGYGVSLTTSRQILQARNRRVGKKFTSLSQIDSVKGVGLQTLHNILYTFMTAMQGKQEFDIWLETEGNEPVRFFDVSGIASESQIFHLQEIGGKQVKRPGPVVYPNVVLKRVWTESNELRQWHAHIVDGKNDRRSGRIAIHKRSGALLCTFQFYEAWPARIRVGIDENAGIIEEIELAVERIAAC